MTTEPDLMADALTNLSDAINVVLMLSDEEQGQARGALITQYVVLTARQHLDEDDDPITRYEVIDGGSMSTPHSALGLVELMRGRLRSSYFDCD